MEAPKRIYLRKVDENDKYPYWWEGAQCGGVRINDADVEYVPRGLAVQLRTALERCMADGTGWNFAVETKGQLALDETAWLSNGGSENHMEKRTDTDRARLIKMLTGWGARRKVLDDLEAAIGEIVLRSRAETITIGNVRATCREEVRIEFIDELSPKAAVSPGESEEGGR